MTIDEVREEFESLSEERQFSLWEEFCRNRGYYDEEVFYNDDDFFDEMFSQGTEIARAVFYSGDDYRYCDKYVKFTVYGNLKSAAYLKDLADLDNDEFLEFVSKEEEK